MITKNITIKIELEAVLPEAEELLPETFNRALNEVYHKIRNGNGGIPAFREQWAVDISAKQKNVGAVDPEFEQPEMQIQQSEEF